MWESYYALRYTTDVAWREEKVKNKRERIRKLITADTCKQKTCGVTGIRRGVIDALKRRYYNGAVYSTP